MARARNIKPGFFRDAALVELPVETRLLFPGLWTIADRDGRLEDKPKQIKMEIYPADSFDVESMLCQLADAGLIIRYEADGKRYIQIKNFAKHQNPHRDEKASIIPAPCVHSASTVPPVIEHGGNPADSLIPDSGYLKPDTRILIPEKKPLSPVPAAPERIPKTGQTWEAYRAAYQRRYGVEPTRNASVNAQLAKFINRVPLEDAPHIAAFYVTHNKSFYVGQKHPVGLLLKDAEGLRTEWLSGRTVTDTEARQADRTQATGNVFGRLLEEVSNG